MKQKKQKIQILTTEMQKYCPQIGIPEGLEPRLVWNKRIFSQITGRRKKSRWTWGACSFTANTILVDLEIKGNLTMARSTLAHEMVHMRWQKKPHGKKFEELVRSTMRGTRFPMRTEKDEQPYFNRDKK